MYIDQDRDCPQQATVWVPQSSASRAQAEAITPQDRAGDFAQAMMDLGSSVCTSKTPKCLLCPLASTCQARAKEPERLPVKPPKKAKPERVGKAFWIEREGPTGAEVWIVTRPGEGMLGGMRALPDDGWSAREDGSKPAPLEGEAELLGAVRHTFTHAHLTLSVERIVAGSVPDGKGEWWPIPDIEAAGLPTDKKSPPAC